MENPTHRIPTQQRFHHSDQTIDKEQNRKCALTCT